MNNISIALVTMLLLVPIFMSLVIAHKDTETDNMKSIRRYTMDHNRCTEGCIIFFSATPSMPPAKLEFKLNELNEVELFMDGKPNAMNGHYILSPISKQLYEVLQKNNPKMVKYALTIFKMNKKGKFNMPLDKVMELLTKPIKESE